MENIVKKAEAFITAFLNENLPPWAVYHSFEHTQETAAAAQEIAAGMNLNRVDTEVVQLAAWFHDAGYAQQAEGHEELSVNIAREFLMRNGYPEDRIEKVAGAIRATKMPQRPTNVLEEVVADADLSHLGRKRFVRKGEVLRLEMEMRTGTTFSDEEWLSKEMEFAASNNFHTTYAREQFGERRMKNLMELQERHRDGKAMSATDREKLELKKKRLADKEERASKPERGIETMFRVVPKNHLDLSSLADHKANIMISTNAIIISIVFGLLLSKLDTHPFLMIPTFILLAVCLCAMVFAILATRPHVTSGTFSRDDIKAKKTNLLFFGNFHNSTLEDFEWGMKEMMNDREYLYGSMIKDLYFLGRVLGVKYHRLRICYNIFMYGLIVAVVAFGIALLTAPPIQ